MAKTYEPRPGFDDGIDRAGVGVFLRLSENQVKALEQMAGAAGKSVPIFLRDIGESVIGQVIPADPRPSSTLG